MPIYEYTCKQCTHEFEVLVLKGKEPASCPQCQGADLERLFSLPSVRGDGTKEKMLRGARARDKKIGAEREHAQREYEKNHD